MALNEEQKANLEADGEALTSALCSAWRYFYLLRGFHTGANNHSEALDRCPAALAEIWRALFWALIATTGTLIDKTPNTHSLPTTLKRIRKYFGKNSELGSLASDIGERLEASDGPFSKIQEWRHKVVAHNARDGADVFENRPMDLDEIEQLLDQLTNLVDEAIWNSIAAHYYHLKEVAQEYEEHGKSMFAQIAA